MRPNLAGAELNSKSGGVALGACGSLRPDQHCYATLLRHDVIASLSSRGRARRFPSALQERRQTASITSFSVSIKPSLSQLPALRSVLRTSPRADVELRTRALAAAGHRGCLLCWLVTWRAAAGGPVDGTLRRRPQAPRRRCAVLRGLPDHRLSTSAVAVSPPRSCRSGQR